MKYEKSIYLDLTDNVSNMFKVSILTGLFKY